MLFNAFETLCFPQCITEMSQVYFSSVNGHVYTFTFMHLANAFIQSDLHCIQVTVSTFYQLLLSLGIEPMILALLYQLSYRKAVYIQFNSIQDYLYSAFHDTIVAKQLYRKLSSCNRFIFCRNLIYLTYDKIWLILYIL